MNARHGGVDSRQIPGGQTPEDVAAVIAGVIDSGRPDVYTPADLFGDYVTEATSTQRAYTFRFGSAEEFVAYFRRWYGPTLKAFDAVDDTASRKLAAELADPRRQHAGRRTQYHRFAPDPPDILCRSVRHANLRR